MELQRHRLNESFEWSTVTGPFRRITGNQSRAYNENGYFLLENVLDAETLRTVTAEIDPLEAQVEAFLRTREDGRFFIARAGEITFSPHLVVESPTLRAFCSGTVFQDVAHDLIGPNVRLYWDQAVYKKPGTAADFPWHQDNGYTYVEPQQYLTCWVALTDVTEANGCPWVVPGLHRHGTLGHWMTPLGWRCLEHSDTAVPTPARAGSIVVFSSLTPHRTGPNLTDKVRKAYIVQFAPDGARTIRVDEHAGARREEPCNDPHWQFPVLIDGRPA